MFDKNYQKEDFNVGGYIGLTQINSAAGDFEYNAKKIAECIKYAEILNLDMVVFPEFALSGYSFSDMFKRHKFLLSEVKKWLNGLAKITKNTYALVCFEDNNGSSAGLLQNGKVIKVITGSDCVTVNGKKYGITIGDNEYQKSDVLINCTAIPSRKGSYQMTAEKLLSAAKKYKTPIIHVNSVGAVDNFSFEGASTCVNADGEVFARAKSFEEDFIVVNPKTGYGEIITVPNGMIYRNDISTSSFTLSFTPDYEDDLERTYKTIIQGIRDYFSKCGLKRAVLGLSGGLDSTVCAVLLADALGKENVVGVSMPSKLTSDTSKSDAKQLAGNLGIHFAECSIKPMFDKTTECLEPLFSDVEKVWADRYKKSFTPDNIQARTRASYIWNLSNEFPSCIPIATSDKSEAYMGYATINGDMSGGFAPIADVTKTKLFALAKWLNKNREQKNAIPESVILKKPGAELAIDPKTGKTLNAEDALMPYEFLDEVIWRIENKNESYSDMLNSDFYYEKKNNISKEQKAEWLDKFFRRMSGALYKWSISAPSVIVDSHSINKAEYYQPITSGRVNYKGSTAEEIDSILN